MPASAHSEDQPMPDAHQPEGEEQTTYEEQADLEEEERRMEEEREREEREDQQRIQVVCYALSFHLLCLQSLWVCCVVLCSILFYTSLCFGASSSYGMF